MVSVTYPTAWRSIAESAVASAREEATSIVITGARGIGRGNVLDLVENGLIGEVEHVLRLDGSSPAAVEVQLRPALLRAGIDVEGDTFESARRALEKRGYLVVLLDRTRDDVLAEFVTPRLDSAVIATATPAAVIDTSATVIELPEYPARRAWNEVRRRRDEQVLPASSVKGPVISTIPGLSRLPDRDLRDLVETAEAEPAEQDRIEMRHLAGHLMPGLSDAQLGLLRALVVLGPGRTLLSDIGSIQTSRVRHAPTTEIPAIAETLAELGLIALEDDIAFVDSGLIAALDAEAVPSTRLRRAALHLATQIRATGSRRSTTQLACAVRLLRWCDERGVEDSQVVALREFTIEQLVDAELLRSAIRLLDRAAMYAGQRSSTTTRAHHCVDAGLLHVRLGEYNAALTVFQEALSDFGKVRRSQRHEAITLFNIGSTLQQVGRHRDAVDTLDQARAVLQRASGDRAATDLDISISLIVSLVTLGERSRAVAEVNAATEQVAATITDEELAERYQRRLGQLRRVVNAPH